MKKRHRAATVLHIYAFTLLFVFLLSPLHSPDACAAEGRELVVSAAISLKDSFNEIGKIYQARYSAKVLFNFGASGTLARQIEGGAPVDVFASAAQQDMDLLEDRGLLVPKSRANFAGNSVVLIVPSRSVLLRGFEGLRASFVKKIAVGNPKTVPAGRYAAEALDYYRLAGVLGEKLVFTENVRQALDYVARGEVDAGIVYATDAALRSKEVTTVATAAGNSHRPIVYPIAIVKDTKNRSGADIFIALVLSPEGQGILRKYGFKEAR